MNKDLRAEFESLCNIEELLNYCVFHESHNKYYPSKDYSESHEMNTEFVNGAWCIYQEQSKRFLSCINTLTKL